MGADTLAGIQAFGRKFGVPFPLLVDSQGTAFRLYRIQGIPHSILLNSRGEKVLEVEGFDPGAFRSQVIPRVASLLEPGPRGRGTALGGERQTARGHLNRSTHR